MQTKSMIKLPAKATLLSAIVALLLASFALFAPVASAVGTPTAVAIPSTLTSYQFGFSGLRVTGENYEPNSVITPTFDGTSLGGQVTIADAQGKLNFTFARQNVAPGVHTLTFTAGSASATASFTVTPNPVPTVTLTPSTISSADLAASGVQAAGSAFGKYKNGTLVLDGSNQHGGFYTDGEGNFTRTILERLSAGQHTLVFTDEAGNSVTTTLTVTGETPAAPQVILTPSTISAAQLATNGSLFEGKGFPANSAVSIVFDHSGDFIGTAQTDAQGKFSFLYKGSLYPQPYDISFSSAAFFVVATLNVTAGSDAPAAIDPAQEPTESGQGSLPTKEIPAIVSEAKAIVEKPVGSQAASQENLAETGINAALLPLALLLLVAGSATFLIVKRRTLG